jgi:sec-independent protein translocase protein TatB
MFDISLTEMAILGAVALIVIGPERLPRVARTAGHLFGRFQRYVASVRADIQREIDASELAKVRQEVDAAARVFEDSVREQARSFESDLRALESSPAVAQHAASATNAPGVAGEPDAAGSTAAALSAGQEAAFATPEPTTADASPQALADGPAILQPFAQGAFDFGIEPLRGRRT